MTYNWNTMVEITVPTGTNGWLYSGEVIINGVKVRFPVGVPTSVPEPAAVLLKKMIELEQEEDANTAKPQNHYVGDVTIPAGKTLTLEKGAKFVDNSAPSEVVILPETEIAVTEGQGHITTPLSATPTAGATAEITYNGTKYTSPIVHAEDDGFDIYAMGNTDLVGVPGGNPDAPFVVMLVPDGMEGMYGTVLLMDGATTITLSIVQTEGGDSSADAGGGTFIVEAVSKEQVENTDNTVKQKFSLTLNKSYAETLTAFKAGKYVAIDVPSAIMDGDCTRIPAVVDLGEAMLFSALTSRIELQVELSASGAVLKYYNY